MASSARPGTDAPATDFKLAAEAQRITLAGLFNPMMAVTTSAVEPLPHQIRAVYGELLPRTPLRFLLADDPGAGKTIMLQRRSRPARRRSTSRWYAPRPG